LRMTHLGGEIRTATVAGYAIDHKRFRRRVWAFSDRAQFGCCLIFTQSRATDFNCGGRRERPLRSQRKTLLQTRQFCQPRHYEVTRRVSKVRKWPALDCCRIYLSASGLCGPSVCRRGFDIAWSARSAALVIWWG